MTGVQRVIFSLIPTLTLLGIGECATRAYYYFSNGRDARFLTAPLGEVRLPLVYPYDPRQTHTELDPCSGRRITFTINEMGRGPSPSISKAPGRIRIMAVGASSTYGINNPDDATWPAFLEEELRRRYGSRVEVLNAGRPGYQLEDFLVLFPSQLIRYQPDIVLFYEGWNDTHLPVSAQVHHNVRRFNTYSRIGSWASWAYGRSMLYTYLLEKTQFYQVGRQEKVVPEIPPFQEKLTRFVQFLREHGVRPIFVLQVYNAPPEPAVRQLSLEDREAVREFILGRLKENRGMTYDRLMRIRVLQAQVMVEEVRRLAQALDIQVIDPTPSFLAYQGKEPLFCDVVHLTDVGNRILARAIREQIRL